MKVKLLRSTMIAGTPTSAGSIIDVEEHIGFMLLNINKAEEYKAEEPKVNKRPNFERMTKLNLESYGKDLGLELDITKTKTELITEIETAIPNT